ncbi:unnamed protein product [Schistosoma curassoni]|uniref:Transmembrane protein n=1 Tax=Schistosoma curassoni TaxID=6186 RepID=A0A183K5U2_9TREM|nr:unnamed protein product [Schistosoma curassoni]
MNQQTNQQSFILIKYLIKPWLLIFNICIILILLLCNTLSSWIIVNDLNQQLPGLVYDQISNIMIHSIILFNIIELTLNLIEFLLWFNIIRNKFTLWLLIDCITIINILIAELPLMILYTYLYTCQESIISIGYLIKGICIILLICLRLLISFISYIHMKSNDSYMKSINSMMKESQYLLSHCHDNNNNKQSNQINNNQNLEENFIWKQKYWLLIRILLCFSCFCLFIIICILFNFFFHPSIYTTYLLWNQFSNHQQQQQQQQSLLLYHLPNHSYLNNVEIFLKDLSSNHSQQSKWYHLISLKQIIHLKSINANESVTLTFYLNGRKKFIEYKQTIYYQNYTKEHSSSCWQILNHDLYKEFICPPLSIIHTIKLIHRIKIDFIYNVPSKRQPFGMMFFNRKYAVLPLPIYAFTSASDPPCSSMMLLRYVKVFTSSEAPPVYKFREHELTFKYFQNTIVHFSSKKTTEIQGNHDHDEWSSGPFRSNNLEVDDHQYTKYRSSDLVPVKELWKTGIAKCQSTAPIGPQKM